MPPWAPASGQPYSLRFSHQHQFSLGLPWRDFRPRFAQVHIDFTPDSEPTGEVDTRFDREAHTGDQRPLVRGLEVVDVGTRAMQIAVNRVPGAMDEVFAEPGCANDRARGIVDGSARHGLIFLPTLLEQRDRRIARATHPVP